MRVIVVGLLVVCVAACTTTGAPTDRLTGAPCRTPTPSSVESPPTLDRAHDLIREQVLLVDRSRPTPAIPDRPASSCRALPTEIRVPAGPTGPRPLLVVAHGLDGSPRALATLLDAWAAAGYVVAAPTFPTTRKDANGAPLLASSAAQADDLSFLVTQLLHRDHARGDDPLRGRIDGRRIGAAGMSLGGLAVYGLVSNSCCRDRRVRAAVLMAAVRRQFPEEHYEPNRVPVMLVQGDVDPGYHNSRDAYPELAAPKWFVTLHGSNHSPPFEEPPGPEAPAVYAMTTAFWDRYLADERDAADLVLATAAASGGQITVQRDLGTRG